MGLFRTAIVGCVALGVVAGAAVGQSIERLAQAAIDKARLGQSHVGVSVLDIESGRELVSITRGGKDPTFIPASNLKLLTSGAALAVLGPDFEFKTSLLLDGDRLIIKGAGDPALADPELLDKMHMSVGALVDKLADSVRMACVGANGTASIREIIIDDRVFDREYVHTDWPAEQLNRSYCAPVSGLNFHANVLNVFVGPAAGGDVNVRTEPSGPWITIRRMARSVKEGSTEVWLDRDKEPFTFRLHGTVRNAPDVPVQVTVGEPQFMLAKSLAERLQKMGVTAQGALPSVRLASLEEQVPENATVAGVVRTPLHVVLERCNTDSDNLYAESLLKLSGHKATGQAGSWANGTAVVRMQVKEKLGGDMAARLVMSDGSGLSRLNRVTPELLTRWLGEMSKIAGADQYISSLARAGEEGTLKKRFKGVKLKNEVRAKSGYIRNVRTLSGYVTDPSSGKRLAFSVMVDDLSAGADGKAKELHEDIVEIVDNYLASQTGRGELVKQGKARGSRAVAE